MVNSTFVSDAEVLSYLSASYCWLYDLLVSKGLSYYETSADYSTAGAHSVSAPASMYGVTGVYVKHSDNNWSRLAPIGPAEVRVYDSIATTYPTHYRVVGQNATTESVMLYPWPAACTVRVYYIPVAGQSQSASDSVNGVSGWEELIVIDTAIKMLQKEESSTTALERERDRLLERIDEAAENRIFADSARIADVDTVQPAEGSFWPYYGGRF
jgi:uncharacterized protein YqgV (UPF0045/DUF77 family)